MNADQKVRYGELKRKYGYKKFVDKVFDEFIKQSGIPAELLQEKYFGYSEHRESLVLLEGVKHGNGKY